MIGTNDQALIARVIQGYARENARLVDQLVQLQYYFRGSLTRDDIWAMSPIERERWTEFLNKRFEEIGDMMKKGVTVSY